MSNIYITEPHTKGKVILKTTFGDLDVELWAKETPKAVRNFVQLCLEGYYNDTIFHRIVKGFIAQGGDPTGTGFGGESIYGQPFPAEFHTRLRFSHRGILAMAGTEPNDNKSQFFFTLDKCPELQGKHTIFGKIVGDTVFNLLKLNDYEIEDERPLNPPKILSVDVVWNPFEDIVPRIKKEPEKPKEPIKKVQKVKKNMSLLSFEEEEGSESVVSLKMKSAHAFAEDPKERESAEEAERRKQKLKEESQQNPQIKSSEDVEKIREKLKTKKRKIEHNTEENSDEELEMTAYEKEKEDKLKLLKEEQKKLKKEILSVGKKKMEEESQKVLSALEEQREKYLSKKKQGKPSQSLILEKLNMFTESLSSAPMDLPEETIDEEKEYDSNEEVDPVNWKYHQLKFKPEKKVIDPSKSDPYKTYDPLENKPKPASQHKRRLAGEKKLEKW